MTAFSHEEASLIAKKAKQSINNDHNYRLLYKNHLERIWERKHDKRILFSIAVTPDDTYNLCFDVLQDNLNGIHSYLDYANFIVINKEGIVTGHEYIDGDGKEIQKRLMNKSYQYHVFFFGEEGISRYTSGMLIEEENTFYSREDRRRYIEKKDISHINEVMENYSKQYVTQQVNYMVFFADNALLRRIDPKLATRNILRNSPEKYMRDQLRQYLTNNMPYTFTIEPELGQSKRELDIFFEVKGDLYIIEIKWLGTSVNSEGNGLGTTYTDSRAREGKIQTLEYIQELSNTEANSIRQGYLVVYDARDRKKEIDFGDESNIRPDLLKYLNKFKILKVVPLEKRHPA